jgi:signal transduction histidine kinase
MTTINTQVIREEPHAEIGALVQCSVEILVERWCARALAEQSVARQVHHAALRDHLPKFLKAIGQVLSQSGTDGTPQHRLPALEHGEERWVHGWSLTELVRDYQLLRLVILEYLEQSLCRPLHTREMMAVGVFIDDAIAASIGTYVAKRDEEVRTIEMDRIRALEQANRRKDEFMAVLAHELRNPLAPIADSVKILRALLMSPPARIAATIDVVDRQSHQLMRLVDDLLDVARMGLGRLELRRSRFNLAAVLEEAMHASAPAFRAKEHEVTLTLPESPVYLEADRERLIQVVCNLLNNAAKYTPSGGHIQLIGGREGENAVIRVRDNGIGIAPEMISRVFEMFTQLDESREYAQDGLGIGLTLVRRLVEQHGGTVTCASDGAGCGSEFVVRLPAEVEVSEGALHTRAAPRPGTD